MLKQLRFISSISMLYILTLGTIGGILYSSHLFGEPVWATSQPTVNYQKPAPLPPKIISGKPVRLTIPSAAIDLHIIDGTYDEATEGWTLTDDKLQFATMSASANDHAGTTFVYGHGTDAVLGKIGTNRPPVGTTAQLVTDNGHTFKYVLTETKDNTPDDVAILADTASGPPRLVVQTCTGAFSQWRTMFVFAFDGVAG